MGPLMLLMLFTMARSQTTPDYTVTYNPGQDCLPNDGSVVPDCSKFWYSVPYYHEHSTNCSRFWECYEGVACLFECPQCQKETNPLCNGQWSLSFDIQLQYPGPLCSWPSTIDCSKVVCDERDPRPECCQDSDCQNISTDDYCPEAYCSTSFNCANTCQGETTTEDYTVTYNPSENCLPYDGSVVPDCSKFWDSVPFYHEHSTNCSRFWECYEGLACLVECPNCQHVIGENSMCEDRLALSFNVNYLVGPVCDLPGYVDCTDVVCDEMEPRPECCQDSECHNVGSEEYCPDAFCSTTFNCVYPESCGV